MIKSPHFYLLESVLSRGHLLIKLVEKTNILKKDN